MIAQKGLSTKQANKKAIAEGKEPLHGVVGKQKKKAAKNAAYAATTTATILPTPSTPEPTPIAAPAPGAPPPPATVPHS